jgi:ribosomal protein L37AE/L43A
MGYFLFDIKRDKDGNPIEDKANEKVRCPNCEFHSTMRYESSLESWICPTCMYEVIEGHDQLPLPSQQSRLEPQSKGKQRFYMKSFSSDSQRKTISEELISSRGEEKQYRGSAQSAIADEYAEFQTKQHDDRDDIMREVYNDTQLNQGSENEILRFRADRERRRQMEENR